MLNENTTQHNSWRKEIDGRLWALMQWLEQHELLAADVKAQIEKMRAHNRSEKIIVAFVAELSHGKSELINAILFSNYGKRIINSSEKRKTVCPIEMGYNENDDICLRLLPIQTRLEPQSLIEWQQMPEQWSKIEFDKNNADQFIEAVEKANETIFVSAQEARALGFGFIKADDSDENSVEIPRWRHAQINIDHPLLQQGLVILDTPGLNDAGIGSELIISLTPHAQAAVFIMPINSEVATSDLTIYREFFAGKEDDNSRFVVLNKIDTLWDDSKTAEQNDVAIEIKRLDAAHALGVSEERVMAVSAKKGLLAKINNDEELLKRSHIELVDNMLGNSILQRRDEIMYTRLMADLQVIQQKVRSLLNRRASDLYEQLSELNELQAKNETIMHQQRLKITQDQDTFEVSVGRIHAIRIVHYKILQQIYTMLGNNHLLRETSSLKMALQESGFMKVGVKKAYADTFVKLYRLLDDTQDKIDEVHTMFNSMFMQLNSDYGFELKVDAAPQLDNHLEALKEVEESNVHSLGVGNLIQLSQQDFIDRLLRALVSQLRLVFEQVLTEVEQWSRGVSSQIDAQLRERRRSLKRRVDAIDRAETASGVLKERIQEIQHAMLDVQHEQSIFNALLEKVLPAAEVHHRVWSLAKS